MLPVSYHSKIKLLLFWTACLVTLFLGVSCTTRQKPSVLEWAQALPHESKPLALVKTIGSTADIDTLHTVDYLKKGKKLYQEKKYEDALIALKLAISYNAYQPETYIYKALCYLELDNPKQALLEVNKAHALNKTKNDSKLRARIYINLKEPDSVIQYSNRCIQQEPANTKCYQFKGQAFQIKMLIDSALVNFKMALKLDPSHSITAYRIGKIYLDDRKIDSATHYLERSHRLDSIAIPPLLTLANIYLEQNKYEKSQNYSEEILVIESTNIEAQEIYGLTQEKLGFPDHAHEIFREILIKKPNSMIALKSMSEFLVKQNDGDSAILLLDSALKIEPQNDWMISQKIWALQQTGQSQLAQHELTKLSTPSMISSDTWIKWAKESLQKKNPSKALEELEEFEKYNGATSNSKYLEYLAYQQLSASDQAEHALQKSIQLDNNSPQLIWEYCRWLQFKKRFEDVYTNLILIDTNQLKQSTTKRKSVDEQILCIFNLQLMKARTLDQLKRHTEAIVIWEQLLKTENFPPSIYLEASASYTSISLFDKALANVNLAIQKMPDEARAYLQRAQIHFYRKSSSQALADCSRALTKDTKLHEAHYMRAQILEFLGEKGAALSDYAEAVRLAPNNNQYQKSKQKLLLELQNKMH